jgi:hypothetical protein
MATFNKVLSFVEKLAKKQIDLSGANLTIALTNTPHTAAWTALSDLTQISYTNCSPRVVSVTSCLQTAGVLKLLCAALLLTASGAVGPFQYVYLYDATSGYLIGYYDYGSAVTLNNGDTFNIAFDQANGVLTIT